MIEFRAHFPIQLTDLSPKLVSALEACAFRHAPGSIQWSNCFQHTRYSRSSLGFFTSHIPSYPALYYPAPPQNLICDIAKSSMSKSPISPPELFALAINRLHKRRLLEASSTNSCIAVPPPSRRRNIRSTIRTRFQHPIAHPFL